MTTISKLNSSLVIIAMASSFWTSTPDSMTQTAALPDPEEIASGLLTIEGNSLVSSSALPLPRVIRKMDVLATAYSSSPWETDDSPFITASGAQTKNGIIANNMLPFGTKVRIPALYGDRIFVVEDRMNSRKSNYQIDIWFPSHQEAKNFGVKITQIEIVGG